MSVDISGAAGYLQDRLATPPKQPKQPGGPGHPALNPSQFMKGGGAAEAGGGAAEAGAAAGGLGEVAELAPLLLL